MDILNESLGDECVYYITDNIPIFNIDGLVESYQCDIRDILMESSGGDKRKKFIDWIRTLGKKILSFLSSILEKVKNYFIKFREYMTRKIEQLRRVTNKNTDGKIIDSKEYSHRKRNGKNKNGNDDEVDEEKLNIVRHKDDIAEEKRQEEEKRKQDEERNRKYEEQKKETYEYYKKEYDARCNRVVPKQCNFMAGISEVNKLLDIYQHGFDDYIAGIKKFRNVQLVLKNMGIDFSDGKVTRLDGKKDNDASEYLDKEFMPLVNAEPPAVYTNGKFKTNEDIDNEYKKIKQAIYGNDEKIKLVDFKGDVENDTFKYMKELKYRISKIGEISSNICNLASRNTENFLKEVEKIAEQIYAAGQGDENRVISVYLKIFVSYFPKCIKNLTVALEAQARSMATMANIMSNAAVTTTTIYTDLTLMRYSKNQMDSELRESVNDYDGMNWLRDILFEHY
jgi:hypothetical protein